MDSLSYLQEKLTHLRQKYPHRVWYCALRMAISSIHAIFMHYDKSHFMLVQPFAGVKKYKLEKGVPVIIFSIKGGLGDLIIACNYICHFYKYLSDATFSLKIHYHSQELLNSFCSEMDGVVETGTRLADLKGDLTVELNRFPCILTGNTRKMSTYSPKLGKLLTAWNNFFIHNRKFFDLAPQIDGLGNNYAQLLGAKRINQADIGGMLHIDETYHASIPYPKKIEHQILNKFKLRNQTFITVQRGQSIISNALTNTKLWPPENYDSLLKMLKELYPSLTIVQLGINRPGFSHDFHSVDVNLKGKTNLEDIKVLLKHSSLHIDSEGGLVHLRHALKGGPSVVLFGPTSPSIYGYKENLNLRSPYCPYPCEWVTDDWQERCPRRNNKNQCLKSLTPKVVFEEIKRKFNFL